jgi:predicted DNA-binding antitoxin AbrB/MazE fold protein
MRPVEALYEDGMLRPAKPLNLRPGERVAVIVVRQPDASRWDLARLGSAPKTNSSLLEVLETGALHSILRTVYDPRRCPSM